MAAIDPALTCALEHCAKRRHQRGFCVMHYTRLVRTGEVGPALRLGDLPNTPCEVDHCGRFAYAKGLCNAHYTRSNRGQSLATPIAKQNAPGESRYVGSHGYVFVTPPEGGSPRREHHVVMEQVLGRRLHEGENVHHINGIRDDNRPENLELWISSQPSGQRVEDLVKWAHEVLARYGGEV